jgi:hypothetical protein
VTYYRWGHRQSIPSTRLPPGPRMRSRDC